MSDGKAARRYKMKKIFYAEVYAIDLFGEELKEWKNRFLFEKKVRYCMRHFSKETMKHHFDKKIERMKEKGEFVR